MAKTDNNLLKEAIADAKKIKDTALANAKQQLEEAFTPHLQSLFQKNLQQEMDDEIEDEFTDDELDEMEDEFTDDELEEIEDEELEDIEGVEDEELDISDEIEDEELDNDFEDEVEFTDDELDEILDEMGEEDDEDEEYEDEIDDDFEDEIDDDFEDEIDDDFEDEIEFTDNELDEILSEFDEEDIEIEDDFEDDFEDEDEEVEPESDFTEDELDEILKKIDIEDDEDDDFEDETEHAFEAQLEKTTEKLEEAYTVIRKMKRIINDVNLINSKLLYLNKLMEKYDLSKTQKLKLVESFDNAETLKEAKLVYGILEKTLSNKISSKKRIINKGKKRTLKEGLSSKPIPSIKPKKQIIKNIDPQVRRMQELAGIIKPK